MCTPFILCRDANAFGLAFLLFLGALRLELTMLCKEHGFIKPQTKPQKTPTKFSAINFTLEKRQKGLQ